jgi:hypothetical protein
VTFRSIIMCPTTLGKMIVADLLPLSSSPPPLPIVGSGSAPKVTTLGYERSVSMRLIHLLSVVWIFGFRILPRHPIPSRIMLRQSSRAVKGLETTHSRTSISGTALSWRKPISGRYPVPSDSFHRQNVLRLAGLSCMREGFAYFFPS